MLTWRVGLLGLAALGPGMAFTTVALHLTLDQLDEDLTPDQSSAARGNLAVTHSWAAGLAAFTNDALSQVTDIPPTAHWPKRPFFISCLFCPLR